MFFSVSFVIEFMERGNFPGPVLQGVEALNILRYHGLHSERFNGILAINNYFGNKTVIKGLDPVECLGFVEFQSQGCPHFEIPLELLKPGDLELDVASGSMSGIGGLPYLQISKTLSPERAVQILRAKQCHDLKKENDNLKNILKEVTEILHQSKSFTKSNLLANLRRRLEGLSVRW